MSEVSPGWFELVASDAPAGTRYCFVLEDGTVVPDPAGRYLPDDVHGPSEVLDPQAFAWSDGAWTGRAWEETIIYEIHIGTFTRTGTFRAAIERLDHLVELGVTALELMPIHDFPGSFGWSYDGAALYAPDASYGHPDDLKALVDAAHARGLMVFLDVVYNHFGPEGNYLSAYAPIQSERKGAEFGDPPNVDGPHAEAVRDFLIENAIYWLTEFHFDGLRLDAVHAIEDNGPKHFLQSLSERVYREVAGRHVHLVTENSRNEAGWLKRGDDGQPLFYAAQWSDDVHHAMHVLATGEPYGYYEDYLNPLPLLGRALAEGFGYQGESTPGDGKTKGEPSAFLPPQAFVSYLQNHDQTGNRPMGERIGQIARPEAVRALASISMLSPHIPLLFMGEEWGATSPFPYFTDVSGDLRDQVRASRQEQLADWPELKEKRAIPDPLDQDIFLASKLDWEELDRDDHAEWLEFYRRLTAVRQAKIIPILAGAPGFGGRYQIIADRVLEVSWLLGDGSRLHMQANLQSEAVSGLDLWNGQHLWLEGAATGDTMEGWCVMVSLLGK